MVRKALRFIILVVCIALATGSALPIRASAATYEPYDGSISTSYITYFQDMLPKKPISENYVFLRSSQYEYKMFVGKFTYENMVLTADGSCYVYTLNVNNGYNSTFSFSQSREDGVVVDPGSIMIYSDLGPWPTLQEPIEYWAYSIFVLLLAWFLYEVIRWVSEVK